MDSCLPPAGAAFRLRPLLAKAQAGYPRGAGPRSRRAALTRPALSRARLLDHRRLARYSRSTSRGLLSACCRASGRLERQASTSDQIGSSRTAQARSSLLEKAEAGAFAERAHRTDVGRRIGAAARRLLDALRADPDCAGGGVSEKYRMVRGQHRTGAHADSARAR
jgi:hypothetical protein